MRFVVTASGCNDKGKLYDVSIVAKKLNGYWVNLNGAFAFVCSDDIQIVHMTDEEQAMPVYMRWGYPGMEGSR